MHFIIQITKTNQSYVFEEFFLLEICMILWCSHVFHRLKLFYLIVPTIQYISSDSYAVCVYHRVFPVLLVCIEVVSTI